MIRCQNCGTDNLDTAQYCDECGARLAQPSARRTLSPASSSGGGAPSDPASAPPRQKSLASAESPLVVDATPVQPVRPSVPEAPAPAQAKLVILRGGRVGREFPLAGTEWLIGRWDPDHGVFPEVDLDSDDPEANVSRRHARILLREGQYLIEDLGSTNGTFINRGRRLTPGLRYLIQDGDEIIVGKTFLEFKLG